MPLAAPEMEQELLAMGFTEAAVATVIGTYRRGAAARSSSEANPGPAGGSAIPPAMEL